MRPEIYWVKEVEPSRLALMPRPRSGEWLEGEISGWRQEGVEVAVSLLQPHEIRELDLSREPELCKLHGIEFVAFPIEDRGVPESICEVRILVQRVSSLLREGQGVAVHCRAGIGRTGLVGACIALEFGIPVSEVFAVLSRVRGVTVPDTESQIEWVRRYAEKVKN